MKTVSLYIVLFFLCLQGKAQSSAGIQVKVLDQGGKPVSGEAISIQAGDFFIPDKKGEFTLPQEKLKVPVRAEFRNDKFEILEIAYFEEDGLLKIKVNRVYGPDEVLHVVFFTDQGNEFNKKLKFRYKGILYFTNEKGELVLSESIRYSEDEEWILNGYKVVDKVFNSKTHQVQLMIQVSPLEKPIASDTFLLSYEADFEKITREMERERSIFEQKNKEIQEKILKIRDNLLHEDQISDKHRKELKSYLNHMEEVVHENSETIRISEERTKEALMKLRMIIMEKDSLNQIAQGKIVQMEAEQVKVEESYRRKKVIFLVIIVGLLMLAILIYFFAARFHRQKNWLKEVNKRLKVMQEDLTTSLHVLSQTKNQIEEQNNELELFVYKASHDIKGPLRSIIGLTTIGMHDVKDKTAQEYFGHIQKSTQRLDNLLADLLRLTKAKQAEVERKEINLPIMVEEIIQSFKNIQYFNRINIQVSIQEDIHFISDEKMLYSVIQNFVENGIKYCDPAKEDPFLKITIQKEDGKTTFQFRDNGLGIDAEHLPKIFDMFYKINPNSDGTGLGLHIVKVTIEKLNGTLKVRSGKGIGSLFTITFYD